MDKVTINLGNVKEFCEEMKRQKGWLLEKRWLLQQSGALEDSVEMKNLSGLIHLYDEIGDRIAEQHGLPMNEIFDLPATA